LPIFQPFATRILSCNRVLILACGTSYHSGLANESLISSALDKCVSTMEAGIFREKKTNMKISSGDVCIFISQSGTTADTLEALEFCKARGALCIGITNKDSSPLARKVDCCVLVNAGPEFSVASTKAYTSQCLTLTMMACYLAKMRNAMELKRLGVGRAILDLPRQAQYILDNLDDKMKSLADLLIASCSGRAILLIAGDLHYVTCLEANLKIIELSYLPCMAIHTSGLKHGPLALIEKRLPVITFVTREKSFNTDEDAEAEHDLYLVSQCSSKHYFFCNA
jgi:glucosamine--fructose-6-phosphate aminotransferase (isomerizing)